MLQWFVLVAGGRPLFPTVPVDTVDGSLQGIIQMRGAMPYAIGFADKHMIHLYREEYVQCREPCFLKHICCDGERCCALVAIFQHVDARFCDRGEIKLKVIVACVHSPGFGSVGQGFAEASVTTHLI